MRLITRSLGALALFCLTGCAGAPAASPTPNAVSGPVVPNPQPQHRPRVTDPEIKRQLDDLDKSVKALRDTLAPDNQ